MKIADLENRSVAIWGSGKEGLSIARAIVSLFPKKELTILSEGRSKWSEEAQFEQSLGMKVRFTQNVIETLSQVEVVVKSPGVSAYRKELTTFTEKGGILTSGTELWFNEHAHERLVCITGSKGKSTTSSLISHLLTQAGINNTLVGNIGDPLTDHLFSENKPDIWVIELSSFQARDVPVAPTVAVLLNLFEEHLDWHGTVERYHEDKLKLFTHGTKLGSVINGADENIKTFSKRLEPFVYFNTKDSKHVSSHKICGPGITTPIPLEELPLLGEHNAMNICAALTVIELLGISIDNLPQAISSFSPLPHRLSPVGTVGGITFINDSIATIPQATLHALEAIETHALTLIVGGYDRGVTMRPLIDALAYSPIHAVIGLPSTGHDIIDALKERDVQSLLQNVETIVEAVALAKSITPDKGVILLSPAASSFNQFKNYIERGEAFIEAALKSNDS